VCQCNRSCDMFTDLGAGRCARGAVRVGSEGGPPVQVPNMGWLLAAGAGLPCFPSRAGLICRAHGLHEARKRPSEPLHLSGRHAAEAVHRCQRSSKLRSNKHEVESKTFARESRDNARMPPRAKSASQRPHRAPNNPSPVAAVWSWDLQEPKPIWRRKFYAVAPEKNHTDQLTTTNWGHPPVSCVVPSWRQILAPRHPRQLSAPHGFLFV
jgi:hypothetical protein